MKEKDYSKKWKLEENNTEISQKAEQKKKKSKAEKRKRQRTRPEGPIPEKQEI